MGKSGGQRQRRVVDYHMSLHFGICHGPVDAIHSIRIKEKDAFTGNVTGNSAVAVNVPDLFGGDESEGGVRGTFDFLLGGASQVLSDILAAYVGLTGATAPGFRGIASFWMHSPGEDRGFMIGQNNPYTPTVDATVSNYPKPAAMNDAVAQIGADANPAHIIFETYTNADWGMGWAPSSFNLTTWNAVAQTLFDEGFGMSLMWIQPGEIEKFVAEIQDHIQAAIYTDPTTGLIEIVLFRGGYSTIGLRRFDETNSTLDNMERRALEDTVNEIVVTYTDPESEEDATVSRHDLANIAAQNGLIKPDGRNYYGVRNATLATTLAERDLRSASYPLFSTQIITDRKNSSVLPGEVVELAWPEEGITLMLCRVIGVSRGKKGSGKVIIDVMEDIWGLDQGVFTTPTQTLWSDPIIDPTAFAQQSAFTIPYPALSAAGLTPEYADVYVALLAQQGDGGVTSTYTLTTESSDPAGNTVTDNLPGYLQAPFATINTALVAEAETVIDEADIGLLGDITLASGQLFYVGDTTDDTVNEIILLLSYAAPNWTVARGIYDTVPRAWTSGTEAWNIGLDISSADSNIRQAGASVSYWMRPSTRGGTLATIDATELVYLVSDRPHLPFRPANLAVDGDFGFGQFTYTVTQADIAVSWSNRNRTMEDSIALKWDEAGVTPEDGQTTTIQFWTTLGVLVVEYTGLTGSSYNVSFLDPLQQPNSEALMVMRVLSVRDGLESLQFAERLIEYNLDGYGFGYGENYGDNV